jgi:DNA-binding beta-propeller fold protein YncE
VAASCAAGTIGGAGGEFNDPEGVATDAAGNIWVAETNGQRIQKLDRSGKFLLALGKNVDDVAGATNVDVCTAAHECMTAVAGALNGQFNDPRDVATDAAGDVYVADFLNSRVQKFDASGNLLSVIGGGGHGGEVDLPTGVATDAHDNVYVAEEGSNRISKFDSAGHFLFAFGKDVVTGGGTGFEVCMVAASCKVGLQGTLGGELAEPHAVAADATGNIYVVDSDNHRAEKFDASGHFLFAFGEDVDSAQAGTGFEICTAAANCKAGLPGDQAGAFNFPEGIGTDTAGNVYVSDLQNGRIEEFDSSGNLLRVITSSAGSGLRGPAHVSTDAAGDLYVADDGNSRIQEFADALAPPPPPPPPPPAPPPPPGLAPRVTHVSQSHSTWRVGGKLATFAKRAKRPPVGTTFSFVLDQRARVSLAFVQKLNGREVRGRCVAPTRANQHKHACARQVAAATLSVAGHNATNRVAFEGRVSRAKTLKPGRYTLLITATNAAGQRSAPRSLSFTIMS